VAKSDKSAGRRERLAAALRENLKRRKARERSAAGQGSHSPARTTDLPAAGPDRAAKPD